MNSQNNLSGLATSAFKPLATFGALLMLAGCAGGTDALRYEPDTKNVIEYMAFDIALPPSSELDLGGTVVAGTGQNWSGRIALVDPQTRGELLRFFVERGVDSGWELRSTTVSEKITLVLEKSGRLATIEIGGSPSGAGGGFFGGGGGADGRTPVSITVNHQGAVESQRPFAVLPGALLNLIPTPPGLPAPTPSPAQ